MDSIHVTYDGVFTWRGFFLTFWKHLIIGGAILKKVKWHFRLNAKRKIAGKNKGKHPALVVGETDDGSSFVNIGLTKSSKRGHHKNVKIHNPQNWEESSYLRDDIRVDSKEYLSKILEDYRLCPDDIDKIWTIIKKKDSH